MIVHINIETTIITQRLSYVLDFITHYPFLKEELRFTFESNPGTDRTIKYGSKPVPDSVFMPTQLQFFKASVLPINDFFMKSYQWDMHEVYSVEKNTEQNKNFFFNNSAFGFDLFEAIFFHISRYEEYHAVPENSDEMDRIPESNLLIQKSGLEQRPVVDQLLRAFFEAMDIPIEINRSRFIITHDIDKIYKYNNLTDGIKAFFWPIFNRLSLMEGIRNLWTYLRVMSGRAKDPYDTYAYLLRRSEVWREKIVFFMAGGKTRYDLFDDQYRKGFEPVYLKANQNGYQTGIHPSFLTFRDGQMLNEEKQNLEQLSGKEVIYTRQHFLHFDFKKTPIIIENAGLKYDSSIGFTRRIGFRSGTGFHHRLYDFENERPYDFLEMPLVVMDSSLVHQTNDDMELFKTTLFSFVRENSHGTAIVFNFHNSTFDYTFGKRRKLTSIYNELEAFLESL